MSLHAKMTADPNLPTSVIPLQAFFDILTEGSLPVRSLSVGESVKEKLLTLDEAYAFKEGFQAFTGYEGTYVGYIGQLKGVPVFESLEAHNVVIAVLGKIRVTGAIAAFTIDVSDHLLSTERGLDWQAVKIVGSTFSLKPVHTLLLEGNQSIVVSSRWVRINEPAIGGYYVMRYGKPSSYMSELPHDGLGSNV